MSVSAARAAAYKALSAYRRRGMRSEEALGAALGEDRLDPRDAALAARLFYGVIQNTMLCDHYIASFSSIKPDKLQPQVLDILRLGVYQLAFMDKIPKSAAVAESVGLAKKHTHQKAAGYVNAVLRSMSRAPGGLPPVTGSALGKLSVTYSHPQWLVEAFARRLGEEGAQALLAANNAEVPVTAAVNTLRTDTPGALQALAADGVDAVPHPWLENAVEMRGTRRVARLRAFREGLIYIQDPAASLAVRAAEPEPGMTVVDGCAAPGGKSFAASVAMGGRGRVLAFDLSENKRLMIRDGARRLGITNIDARVSDARTPDPALHSRADVVIADVPCSGFGVIRKKPEIRYKRPEDVAGLPDLQLEIVSGLSEYVAPGGVLLYSTCTLLEAENEDVIAAFTARHPEFAPEPFTLPGPVGHCAGGMVTLWPHIHGTDGFFICRLRRRL